MPGHCTGAALLGGVLLLLSACAPPDSGGEGAASNVFADRVENFAPVNSENATEDEWPYFFQPEAALGEPGTSVFDVVSLGYDPNASEAVGGTITLGLGDADGAVCVVDGEGNDLVVYENVFRTTVDGESGTNNEVALVEVSENGTDFHRFPPSVDGSFELYDPDRYTNLAGVTPTDEGGDRFDLQAVIAAHSLGANFRACYVRLIDGGTAWEDYGNENTDDYNSGTDIDAVEALNHEPM